MVGYLALGVALLVGLLLLSKWFVNADAAQVARGLRIGGIVVCVVAVLFLLVTGRLSWLIVPLALLLPLLLRRLGRGLGGLGGFRPTPSGGRSSGVETRYLRMTLDHDSGEMTGEVIAGAFAGRRLEDLGFDELVRLLAETWTEDEQSARVLETYLDRREGADWRERAAASAEGGGRRPGKGRMAREQALEVLGLAPGADADEIKEAHHRLMAKIHPDHGGSTFLAAQINEAKDVLLGG